MNNTICFSIAWHWTGFAQSFFHPAAEMETKEGHTTMEGADVGGKNGTYGFSSSPPLQAIVVIWKEI